MTEPQECTLEKSEEDTIAVVADNIVVGFVREWHPRERFGHRRISKRLMKFSRDVVSWGPARPWSEEAIYLAAERLTAQARLKVKRSRAVDWIIAGVGIAVLMFALMAIVVHASQRDAALLNWQADMKESGQWERIVKENAEAGGY